MRSLIILEVEHGEDTDMLTRLASALCANRHIYSDYLTVTNYTVRVDLPECFRLDS